MTANHSSDTEFLASLVDSLTVSIPHLSPSEWAESTRYLSSTTTPIPGLYSYDVTPYLREITDCLDPASPVRQLAIMKGVQLGLTVGAIENTIGYYIHHVKTTPIIMITADAELAKLRMETNILPMLQASGMAHLIQSADGDNKRKTGKTAQKLEWLGGGWLVPFGAQNADKLRSLSAPILLRDETDAFPRKVGKDGNPLKLSEDRTASYEETRKILDISTPTLKGLSNIEARYLLGDQRKYHVCCVKCGHPQELRWSHTNRDTGEVTGITWETRDDGSLVSGSVRYLCIECGHPHTNADKTKLLSPAYGAHWKPTAEAKIKDFRSYHINSLYSPVGMRSWESCVLDWLGAWDVKNNRVKDIGQLQIFYNNVLGVPYQVRADRLKLSTVSTHKRPEYVLGEIPNHFASTYCGSEVVLLTCSVDVHKDNLAVAVIGWTKGKRAILVDYWRYEGETEHLDNPDTWGRLGDLLNTPYTSDDGKEYLIEMALVDSGYNQHNVYSFTSSYPGIAFPVKGRGTSGTAANFKEFKAFSTNTGTQGYTLYVDTYKERWASALKRQWDGTGTQPEHHFNAPYNISDKALKELTAETKKERKDPATGKSQGFSWERPSGADNELWDCLIYSTAALDVIANNYCIQQLGLASVDWNHFFTHALANGSFTQ